MARVLSILLAVLVAFSSLGVIASADAKSISEAAKMSGYEKNQNSVAVSGMVTYNELDTYEEYLEKNADVPNGKEHIVVGADNLVSKTEDIMNAFSPCAVTSRESTTGCLCLRSATICRKSPAITPIN